MKSRLFVLGPGVCFKGKCEVYCLESKGLVDSRLAELADRSIKQRATKARARFLGHLQNIPPGQVGGGARSSRARGGSSILRMPIVTKAGTFPFPRSLTLATVWLLTLSMFPGRLLALGVHS